MASVEVQKNVQTAGQSQYGRYSTGGKSIEVCTSYGINLRPTAMTKENLRALVEQQRSSSITSLDSPVKKYEAWELSVLPSSPDTLGVLYTEPPFISPNSTSSSISGCHTDSISTESTSPTKTANSLNVNGLKHTELGGMTTKNLQTHKILNLEEDYEIQPLPTSQISAIPEEVRDYVGGHPETILSFIKKALLNGEGYVEMPKTTDQEFSQLEHNSDIESESDQDFDADSKAKSPWAPEPCSNENETETDVSLIQSSSSMDSGMSPRAASIQKAQSSSSSALEGARTQIGNGTVKQYADYNPRKTVVPTIRDAPKKATATIVRSKPARAKDVRPKDNSDLHRKSSSNLKHAIKFDYRHKIPDQELRLRIPYPAPAEILNESYKKFWDELTQANIKIQENPEAKRPKVPWTIWEDDAVIGHMLDIRLDPNIPETEARFKETSRRLLEVQKIDRTETAVKNMWNRVGRARSGFDERKRPGEEMATSLQAGKKRKRVGREDEDSDFEESRVKKKR